MRFHSTRAGRSDVWHQRVAALLEVDPDLGRELDADRSSAARRDLPVRVVALEPGPWSADRLAVSAARHLGVLVVDGLVGRELLTDDVAGMELLGPGDLIRPWDEAAEFELLRTVVRWSALSPTRLALLDRQLTGRLAAYPEIHVALLERTAARIRRLAVLQAIAHVTGVDRRLLVLFWHLAEHWGRVTPDGVLVPLTLSHRMLGQLVGARRPTVSSAIGLLKQDGELSRGADGAWLLTGSPVGAPVEDAARFVAPRRVTLGPAEAL